MHTRFRKKRRDIIAPERFRDQTPAVHNFFKAPKQSVSPARRRASQKNKPKQGVVPSTKLEQSVQSILTLLKIQTMRAEDYIGSPRDKPELFTVGPVHLLNKFSGQGLFAAKDIPAGECFGQYTGEVIHSDEYQGEDNSYAMEVGEIIIEGITKGNFTRFINFSDAQANVEFFPGRLHHEKIVLLKTIKPVRQGEQLLVDYNRYDPLISSEYFFLNPQDGSLSTKDMYKQQQQYYKLINTEDVYIYTTVIGEIVLNLDSLKSLGAEHYAAVNLPYLEIAPSGELMDATEIDLFTPLMMACTLGQVENVQWLIEHGAYIDQQQNHTGNCSLFFALESYSSEETSKFLYVEVMKKLILSKASLMVHNRRDQTFLHLAISVLTPEDFAEIIRVIKSDPERDLTSLYTYLDDQNNDIVISCLQSQSFEHFKILLEAYPKYFKEHYFSGASTDRQDNLKQFNKVTKSYSSEIKEILMNLLISLNLKLTPDFFESIGLGSPETIRIGF